MKKYTQTQCDNIVMAVAMSGRGQKDAAVAVINGGEWNIDLAKMIAKALTNAYREMGAKESRFNSWKAALSNNLPKEIKDNPKADRITFDYNKDTDTVEVSFTKGRNTSKGKDEGEKGEENVTDITDKIADPFYQAVAKFKASPTEANKAAVIMLMDSMTAAAAA